MKEHNLKQIDFELDEIVSIELVGDMPTIDIEVDDTHMFYANDIYTHNSSMDDDIIQADGIADSYRKIMTADFVISLSRKVTDKVSNTARFHIIKNRFGPDGMTFPSRMNAGCGDIQLFDEKSPEGVGIIGKMGDSENIVKKLLNNKWQKHMDQDEENA